MSTLSVSILSAVSTLEELLELSSAELEEVDIALMNLLCAEGLPGSETINIVSSIKQLDEVARYVASETDRYSSMFFRDSDRFKNMEGLYRMQMMVTVLKQDCGIHYNPARSNDEDGKSFFLDSKDLFLTGFTNREQRMGTCASMPVLFVSIGRRLGYPLELVHARKHVFARWEGEGQRFNIEGTNGGMVDHPDEYYKTKPEPLTDEQLESGLYLENLSASQVLASFMSTRSVCFYVNKQYKMALEAARQAHRIEPENSIYERSLKGLQKFLQNESN